MKSTLGILAGVVAVILFFGASIYMTASVWGECRQTNSFFYCVRLVSR